jgi:hypothetical protein
MAFRYSPRALTTRAAFGSSVFVSLVIADRTVASVKQATLYLGQPHPESETDAIPQVWHDLKVPLSVCCAGFVDALRVVNDCLERVKEAPITGSTIDR